MTDLASLAGPSALLAAVATVVGAVTLVVFFAKGGWWGLANDVSSIVLMLATVPVAFYFVKLTIAEGVSPVLANAVGSIGLLGMVGASVAQGLLVARVRTYQQLLPWTLGFGAIVGAWYVGVGITGAQAGIHAEFTVLALLAGLGFISLGYGFWLGNERHPLSMAGGVVVLVSSTIFLLLVAAASSFEWLTGEAA